MAMIMFLIVLTYVSIVVITVTCYLELLAKMDRKTEEIEAILVKNTEVLDVLRAHLADTVILESEGGKTC